ncbi:putative chromatin remodeling & transcription regulator ABTB family [Helianthus annuus]|uniref:Chromatin remodeling & transcription regulator ABTB family n=2 Tax=Helianthus annuus TaxID=4232 RepID=A0A251TM26_HELAN|nr:BTB/POZ domain-containing protein At2g04740 [Helianthus annuus]KAF5787339.1 putative chromatin remodeling & transcription regulator ABTB family [Helianthus annuus]KAJ0514605.1 putative chromatin remodeling & transcription regulator ABTB family [Helianthus annuus]KAJ0522834.1 putative chromatin remodeling & transcription regulator ABTB family [Helianthus annuus]
MSDLDDIDLNPEDFLSSVPLKKVPYGDVFEASRAGDVDRLKYLLESGVNVNARDQWDSVALYYACLAGHLDAAKMLLESGAICSEHTFDGDRCHYAALNLKVRKLLKAFEARPPPLGPLQGALRETFLGCVGNRGYLEQLDGKSQFEGNLSNGGTSPSYFPPDVTFYLHGRPIEAHRVILSARSPYFKKKFETDWRDRKEIRFSREKLSYPAFYSLVHFFYSDRLEIAVDDMEDLVRICKVCKCESLQKVIEKEVRHQKYADYKSLQDIDNSQRRYILQGSSLPEEDRLPAALSRVLQISLNNSIQEGKHEDDLVSRFGSMKINGFEFEDDLADVNIKVDDKVFRCHQVILASRSEYFKTRLSRMEDFLEGKDGLPDYNLPLINEHDLSMEAFEKMIEYMYTDGLKDINPEQAEEMFDAASRYLLFPLKRAVADALLPHLQMVPPSQLCHWLILSDMYGVLKIREYCLDMIACNFETFADTKEFRAMLLTLPPPSGDSSLRTTVPNAPGAEMKMTEGNVLDDLREKWLEVEAGELDTRDESALLFDKRLEMLMLVAQQEQSVADNE